MEVPFHFSNTAPAHKALNTPFRAVGITVEWVLKKIKMHFAAVDFKSKMKIDEAHIGQLYLSSMILSNFRNCLYLNQISRSFKCTLPLLRSTFVTQATEKSVG